MATANPLEEILNSEIDESAISALVGSLESQLASPTHKDTLQQNLTASLHSNHHCGEQDRVLVANARVNQISAVAPSMIATNATVIAGQKSSLAVDCSARVPPQSTNGSNDSLARSAHLIGVNSLGASVAAAGGVTLGMSNVHTCGSGSIQTLPNLTPSGATHNQGVLFDNNGASPKPEVTLATGPGSNLQRHVIVTVGSTNAGTIAYTAPPNCVNMQHINTSTPPLNNTSANHFGVTNVTDSVPASAMYNLANVASQQMPLTLPINSDGTMVAGGRVTVREQLDKQKDTKPSQQVVVNIVNPVSNVSQQQHVVIKSDPDVKFVAHSSNVSAMQVVPNAATNSNIITKPTATTIGQTLKVVRPPSSSTAAPQMQIVNVNAAMTARMTQPNQKSLAPRLAAGTSIRIAAAPQAVPVRTPGGMLIRGAPPQVPGTITLPPGYHLPPGAMLMKNEQGQFVVVSGGPAQQQITAPNQQAFKVNAIRPGTAVHPVMAAPIQPATMTRPSAAGVMATSSAPITIVTAGAHQQVVRGSQPEVQQVAAQSAPHTAAPVAAMQDNVRKCKNFLTALINLAASQPADIVKNVRKLVQSLVDGKIEPDEFTSSLQVELKSSSPQPYLIPFLKKSLPHLRQSMMLNHIHIDGIRPPPRVTTHGALVAPPATMATRLGTPQLQPVASQGARLHKPGAASTASPAVSAAAKPGTQPYLQNLMYQQRRLQLHAAHKAGSTVAPAAGGQTKALLSRAGQQRHALHALHTRMLRPGTTAVPLVAGAARDKHKYESLKDDDDINDVATMGGVNLSEESQNILATNSALMTGQLRSCRDEHFLHTAALMSRINAIAHKHGLDDVAQSMVSIISHATQERLRNIIEKLAIVSEHRLEIHKTNSRYELTTEVRPQLKFLEELDRMEHKRHEETEREVLLRAARSRSKHEDPEQLKLKEKAKALQQAEMEEVRQREANLTALAAIGPRKKRKLDVVDSSGSSTSLSSVPGESNSRTSVLRPRIRRVNLRDLLFVLEQERDTSNSILLYKSYLK